MIFPSNAIISAFKPQIQLKQLQGTGRIVIDKNNIFLHTGSERVALDASLKGLFNNGESVKYLIEKETIYLTPVKEDFPFPTITKNDVLSFAQTPQSSVSSSLDHSISVPSTLPAGYYLFTTVEEALQFLNQPGNTGLSWQLENALAESGIITIKIDRTIASNAGAIIIPTTDLSNMIQSLSGLFSSEALRSLPTELFMNILMKTGTLSIDLLTDIDAKIIEMNCLLPNLRAGSSDAQVNALTQWLQTILSAQKIPDGSTALLPFTAADLIMSKLKSVLPVVASLTNTPLPTIENYILSDTTFPLNRQNTIESAMNNIGFNLEHALSKGSSAVSFDDSIKSLLLHFLSKLTNSTSPISSYSSSIRTDNLRTSINATIQSPSFQTKSLNANSNFTEHLEKLQLLKKSITEVVQNYLPMINETFNRPSTGGNGSITVFPEFSSSTGPVQSTMSPVNTLSSLQLIADTLRSVIPILPEVTMVPFPTNDGAQPQGNKPFEQAAIKKVALIIEQIEQLRTNAPYIDAELSENQLFKTDQSSLPFRSQPVPQHLHLVFRIILDSIDTIISLFNAGTTEMPDNTRNAIPSSEQFPEHPDAQSKVPLYEKNVSYSQQTSSTINLSRQTLTSVLDSLESLQLLARPVTTNEGTQQIIALPIKFGEQLTEINIRLLNYYKGKKEHKEQSHFSVFIDVAPPSLGSIHSHLDYHRSKLLTIAIEFERKSSFEWFEQRKESLCMELQPVFQHSISVDFRLIHKKSISQRPSNKSKNGIIDVKA